MGCEADESSQGFWSEIDELRSRIRARGVVGGRLLLLGKFFSKISEMNFILTNIQIPMVAPFCGCLFGGVLYDLFIYTGPSPINTAMFGLGEFLHPKRSVAERIAVQKERGMV